MMHINWVGYYNKYEGYGRFSASIVEALQRAGVSVSATYCGDVDRPDWMWQQLGVDWSQLTISCMPPYLLERIPGERHWLYTMTEGSEIPHQWAELINYAEVDRILTPCEANAITFRQALPQIPITVLHGGTDPKPFPLKYGTFPLRTVDENHIYTFLTIADRASRKGWMETWKAFYKAFGPWTKGIQNVRLIVKCRAAGNDDVTGLAKATNKDPRIIFWEEDVIDMASVYSCADVVVLPSRFEGWGMPHRESAMMGIPTIVQKHSGLDDGHTEEWAIVTESNPAEPISSDDLTVLAGNWHKANIDELAAWMFDCFARPDWAVERAFSGAQWLRENQTWDHTAARLLQLIAEYERTTTTPNAVPIVTGG